MQPRQKGKAGGVNNFMKERPTKINTTFQQTYLRRQPWIRQQSSRSSIGLGSKWVGSKTRLKDVSSRSQLNDTASSPAERKGLTASKAHPSRTASKFYSTPEKGLPAQKPAELSGATIALGPGTDAYLARAAALRFELHNYHRLPAAAKIRELAPLYRPTRIQAKHMTPIRQAMPQDRLRPGGDSQSARTNSLEAARTRSMHPPSGRRREKNPLHAYLKMKPH